MSANLLRAMIDEVRLHGIESVFRRYYGIYRAKVTSNADKEGRGLIKVQVPGIFGEKDLLVLEIFGMLGMVRESFSLRT